MTNFTNDAMWMFIAGCACGTIIWLPWIVYQGVKLDRTIKIMYDCMCDMEVNK